LSFEAFKLLNFFNNCFNCLFISGSFLLNQYLPSFFFISIAGEPATLSFGPISVITPACAPTCVKSANRNMVFQTDLSAPEQPPFTKLTTAGKPT
jgi:hypothetical protein